MSLIFFSTIYLAPNSHTEYKFNFFDKFRKNANSTKFFKLY